MNNPYKVTNSTISINNLMTKGEVKVIILDGHSNQAFLLKHLFMGKGKSLHVTANLQS